MGAHSGTPDVVVASARALAQLVDAVAAARPVLLRVGDVIDRDSLVERLAAFGYRREHQVEHRGELAVRGSIVDIFPSTASVPVRIDSWGDEIDRLTEFSASDQRATESLGSVEVYPCREMRPDAALKRRAASLAEQAPWGREHWERLAAGEMFEGMESWWPWLARRPGTVVDLLPDGAAVVLLEPRRLRDRTAQISAEEEDLAAVLAETWGTDAADVPRPARCL